MKKLKKILIYLVGGIVGVFVLMIVASMFIDTGSLPMKDKSAGPTDPKLEKLKERDKDLDKVYEGDDSEFVNTEQEQDQELYAEKGELSDFDAMNEPRDRDTAPSGAESPNTPAQTTRTDNTENREPTTPAAPIIEDNPGDGATPDAEQGSDDDSGAPSADADKADAGAAAPAPALDQTAVSDLRDDMLNEVDSLESRLSDEMKGIRKTVQRLDVSTSANDDLLRDLKKMRNNQSAIFKQMKNTSVALAALSERMDKAEEEAAKAAKEASKATKKLSARSRSSVSASTLRNLYQLARIQGGTAVLIGQNTGKRYTVAEGDSLAYGGRVAAVRGDHVTLRWPNATSTLSIY